MNFDLNVSCKQQQKLVMTQQMKISINILQMASYDLREYINREYEENPIIEYQYTEEYIQYKNGESIFKEKSNAEQYGQYKQCRKEIKNENIISIKDKTLKEFLYEQMREIDLTTEMKKVISYMIECLDERGYLNEDVSYITKVLNIKVDIVQKSLEVLQGFDPVGIAAKDIKQCLKLQVKDLQFINEKERKHIYKIIDNYILDVAEGKLEELSSKMKIEEDEVKRYIDIIKKLEPKPSRGFYIGDEIKYIIPDAEIKKENGQYIVLMNDEILPKISINKELIESIVLKDKESASYILKIVKYIHQSEERAVGETYVKRLIKEIIEKEDKTSSVSDQEISDRLLKNTLHISRRTVAKYREQMGISSSNKRNKKLQNKKNI